jgi:hypothetical protein
MPDETPGNPSVPEIQARLHALAERLRRPGVLDADSRGILAELVDELGAALRSAAVPADEVAHLAATTAHLAEVLQHPPEQRRGWLETLQAPLEEAAVRAEAHAPVAVGLVRRLIDALANIGI